MKDLVLSIIALAKESKKDLDAGACNPGFSDYKWVGDGELKVLFRTSSVLDVTIEKPGCPKITMELKIGAGSIELWLHMKGVTIRKSILGYEVATRLLGKKCSCDFRLYDFITNEEEMIAFFNMDSIKDALVSLENVA